MWNRKQKQEEDDQWGKEHGPFGRYLEYEEHDDIGDERIAEIDQGGIHPGEDEQLHGEFDLEQQHFIVHQGRHGGIGGPCECLP